MSAERWLPIEGFEGRYEVSDLGRVRSLLTYRGHPGPRIMVARPKRNGYLAIQLRRADGVERGLFVHRLVMNAFVGPRPEGQETRHLNGDRTDARLSNLAYGTHVENMQDKKRHGTDWESIRTQCKEGHPLSGTNLIIQRLPDGRLSKRLCRICQNAKNRRQWAARKARLKAQQDAA